MNQQTYIHGTLESAIPGVPSCGKFEVEWMLQKIMADPKINSSELIYEAARKFEDTLQEADKWFRHALDRLAAYKDRKATREHLDVKTCFVCEGRGGFLDSTYDRTGTWELCAECDGTGETYDRKKLRDLLGMKVKPHAD